MDREDIIRMARETGVEWLMHNQFYKDHLQHFAALVAAAEREKVRSAMKRAFRRMAGLIRADEREACAKACEEEGLLWGQRYAAAIRARGETT